MDFSPVQARQKAVLWPWHLGHNVFFGIVWAYTLPAVPFLNLTRRGPHDMTALPITSAGTLFAFAASSYRAPLT